MSVYFLAAKVTRTRYTLAGALLATLAGTVASVALAAGIKEHPNDLIILHQCLENFKEQGMSRDAMLKKHGIFKTEKRFRNRERFVGFNLSGFN